MVLVSQDNELQAFLAQHYKDYSIWLTTYGRKTGKPRLVQIWFAYVNGEFYVLARHGLEAWWTKNILKNPTVVVNLSGRAIKGKAQILDDKDLTDEIWKYYKGKYVFYPQIYIFSWAKRKLIKIVFDSQDKVQENH
ncbi:MAG: nitroreductase family deazaflavin-dependent oxidoreductase [Thermoprotei archaeon]